MKKTKKLKLFLTFERIGVYLPDPVFLEVYLPQFCARGREGGGGQGLQRVAAQGKDLREMMTIIHLISKNVR